MRGTVVRRCPVCDKNNSRCKHKEANYAIVYWYGGKQIWKRIGPNKKAAEKRLGEVCFQIEQGIYHKPKVATLKQFVDVWNRDYVGGRQMKPSTKRSYDSMLRHRILPMLGHYKLTEISPHSIQSFMSSMLKKLEPKTANNHLILLKTIFKQARIWRYIHEDPTEFVDKAKLKHKEMSFLEPSQIALLLKHSDEPFKTLFMTAVMTGMRQGELLALKWGDIDWSSNYIQVRRGLHWHSQREMGDRKDRWEFIDPKTIQSRRRIILSPRLKEALEIHRINSTEGPLNLVFCTTNGTPLDDRNLVQREFAPTLERAGIKKIRFHDLRHTFASLLIAQKESPKYISSQMGHASITTTMDRYGHLFEVDNAESGSKLDSQIFQSTIHNRPLVLSV